MINVTIYVMIMTDRNGYNHCCLIAGKLAEVPKSRLLAFPWPTKNVAKGTTDPGVDCFDQ